MTVAPDAVQHHLLASSVKIVTMTNAFVVSLADDKSTCLGLFSYSVSA